MSGMAMNGDGQHGRDVMEIAGEPARPVAVSDASALVAMIERAARDPAVNIEKMERLYDLHRQSVERHARTEFLAAFSALQSQLPAVARGGRGHNDKKYARFEDVIGAVRPLLVLHGFSLSFRTSQGDGWLRVTGVLGHAAGHVETTDMTLPADTSGSKNAVQAWGSSTSYGKRYVALSLLGMATEDDDGRSAVQAHSAPAMITDDQAEQIKVALERTGGHLPKFCAYWKLRRLGDLPAAKFDAAMASIHGVAEKRKAAQAKAPAPDEPPDPDAAIDPASEPVADVEGFLADLAASVSAALGDVDAIREIEEHNAEIISGLPDAARKKAWALLNI